MRKRQIRYLPKIMLAVALLWLQAASLAHAAEYGSLQHEHDGVTCELEIIAGQDATLLPAPTPSFNLDRAALLPLPPYTDYKSWTQPPGRAPPPRSPPHLTQ